MDLLCLLISEFGKNSTQEQKMFHMWHTILNNLAEPDIRIIT